MTNIYSPPALFPLSCFANCWNSQPGCSDGWCASLCPTYKVSPWQPRSTAWLPFPWTGKLKTLAPITWLWTFIVGSWLWCSGRDWSGSGGDRERDRERERYWKWTVFAAPNDARRRRGRHDALEPMEPPAWQHAPPPRACGRRVWWPWRLPDDEQHGWKWKGWVVRWW